LATSVEAREEVERLRLTHRALLSVPDEEVPRRIAFVSDKVFEPSRARRIWQGFWQGAPRLAFGMAAMLAVLFAGAWATELSVTSDQNGWRLAFGPAPAGQPVAAAPDATERPAVVETTRELNPEQVRQVAEILADHDARNREALAELVRTAATRSNAELRAEIEQIRLASEDNYLLQKARWDQLQLYLADGNNLALVGR
jgi:hypothetical protein